MARSYPQLEQSLTINTMKIIIFFVLAGVSLCMGGNDLSNCDPTINPNYATLLDCLEDVPEDLLEFVRKAQIFLCKYKDSTDAQKRILYDKAYDKFKDELADLGCVVEYLLPTTEQTFEQFLGTVAEVLCILVTSLIQIKEALGVDNAVTEVLCTVLEVVGGVGGVVPLVR